MDIKNVRTELRKRGVYVADGDPALDMAVVCEVALAEALKKAEEGGRTQADRLSAAAVQFSGAARAAAAEFVNQVAGQVADQVREGVSEVTASMLEQVRAQAAEAERYAKHARIMCYGATLAAGLLFASVIALQLLRWF